MYHKRERVIKKKISITAATEAFISVQHTIIKIHKMNKI